MSYVNNIIEKVNTSKVHLVSILTWVKLQAWPYSAPKISTCSGLDHTDLNFEV